MENMGSRRNGLLFNKEPETAQCPGGAIGQRGIFIGSSLAVFVTNTSWRNSILVLNQRPTNDDYQVSTFACRGREKHD
jgi:hypothetical protein